MLSTGFHSVAPDTLAAVVTYLEMRRPTTRAAPLPSWLRFDSFPRDIEAYRDLFRRVGQDWLWHERLLLSDDDLRAIIVDPNVQLFSLYREDKAEALLELDFGTTGQCKLAYFGLTAPLIGTGAGAYLMDRAIEKAFAAGIDLFHLHTCTIDSPGALGFYLRSGFTPVKTKVEIMIDPRLTGHLPRDVAPHVPLIGKT